jgi:hypothetical protein
LDVFHNHGYLGAGSTSIYYCDGSHLSQPEFSDGYLASAVVWKDGTVWMTETAAHPRYSGESNDAKLYAVKMAFDVAVRYASDSERDFEDIVVFTDC